MTDKLTLAVNHAISDLRLARARMGMLNPGMGLDAKRSSAWCEYGFKEDLDFHDLYKLYRRGGIANGAVNKLVSNCWKTNPQVIEGEVSDKSKELSAWEKDNNQVLTHRFWRSFAKADTRRLVGRWAGILLHIKDSKRWNEPVVKGRALQKITPVWRSALKVASQDTSGNITMWQYTEVQPDGNTAQRDIHPDRILIIGDMSDDEIGFLEPGYNAAVSLEKVEGGSGESFLKNAARQLNVNFDKEINFSNLASMYGVSVTELQDKFNEAAAEVNRGNDVLLTTQGASVTPLVTAVADPSPTYDVNLKTFAASVDIPSRILVGNQSGERASTEDQIYFNARCQSRRGDLSFDIEDMVNKLIDLQILKPVAKFSIVWDDLNEQSSSDKLDSASKMSDINQKLLAAGGPVFTTNEIRVAAGYEPLGDPLTEDEDEEESEEDSETSDITGQ
ncbi:anti-CBASS protein Acb1 family protein [Mixta calida]|uniref:anti-CBASS protein Acb1 family protein n=1 Tax=Mixta calida TaxID=665913 RepID=UPI00119FD2EA|nr:anti-CBASS Acb1 family protein [Mixta calida]DAV72752.1 MAG TPA: portal [Caudoviricetes sp.]